MSEKDKAQPILIIIGAGLMQLKAIDEAKSLGYGVLAVDQNSLAPGVDRCDYFERISTRNIPEIIDCLKGYQKQHEFAGVFTAGSDVAYTVACIAEAFDLPGITPSSAMKATNKYEMRRVLQEAGVSVPEFGFATTLIEALHIASRIGYPLIIKPVDNMGARGVVQLYSDSDLADHFKQSLSFSGNYSQPGVILEKYLKGDEISMDTLVYDGEVHLITIADRDIQGAPYCVEMGHRIPSTLADSRLEAAFHLMKQAVKAVGITLGAAKSDMILTEQGPYLGEITARLSGGFHSQLTESLATGMNSTRAAILMAVGQPLDTQLITPQFSRIAIERAIHSQSGRLVSIRGEQEALRIPGIEAIIWNKQPGDIIEPLTCNLGKLGNLIASGETEDEVHTSIERAMDCLDISISSHQQNRTEVGV